MSGSADRVSIDRATLLRYALAILVGAFAGGELRPGATADGPAACTPEWRVRVEAHVAQADQTLAHVASDVQDIREALVGAGIMKPHGGTP